MTTSIGPRLRQARLAAGLTAADVAKKAGFTASHIGQIERGVADPSFSALARICGALGLDMSELFADGTSPSVPAASPPTGPRGWVGVVKAHQRTTMIPPGSRVRHELLCPDLQHKIEAFRTILPPGRLAFAGHDLVEGGYFAAELLARAMNGAGNVVITAAEPDWHYSMNRERGARRAFGQYPDIHIIQMVGTGSEPEQAALILENVLRTSPPITGVCALDCFTAQLAAEHARRHDLKGRLLIVGFDEVPASLQLVRDGYITALVDQAAEQQAYETVRMLVDFLRGQPISSVDTGVRSIDSSNVDDYLSGERDAVRCKRGRAIDPGGFNLDPAIVRRTADGKRPRIALSYVGTTLQLAALLRAGVEKAMRDFDVDALLVGPAIYDVAAQTAELESLVQEGIDGLGISSGQSEAMAPVIDRFIAQGIPVVTFNSDNPGSGRLAFVGLDHNAYESSSPTAHDGEEWAIVLNGLLEFVVAERSYVLSSGDTIHFDSSTPHYMRNIGSSPVEVLWVASPPHF